MGDGPRAPCSITCKGNGEGGGDVEGGNSQKKSGQEGISATSHGNRTLSQTRSPRDTQINCFTVLPAPEWRHDRGFPKGMVRVNGLGPYSAHWPEYRQDISKRYIEVHLEQS